MGGIQLNRCHNPRCENFGVEPLEGRAKDGYTRVGGTDKLGRRTLLHCSSCGENTSMMSNAAIVEERARLLARSEASPSVACRSAECVNQHQPVDTHPGEYQRFGRTPAGSPRLRCRRCLRTFSVPARASHRLRRPDKTEQILTLLVNKMPMRRLCEAAGVRPATLYQRIGRLAVQCRSFMATHEGRYLQRAPDGAFALGDRSPGLHAQLGYHA